MKRWHLVASVLILLIGLGIELDPLVAQRGALEPPPQNGRPVYPAAVVSSSMLTAHPDSDELIPGLRVETLSNGMVVASGALPIPTRPVGPRSIFLLVDAQERTYRTFTIRGAVEDNERLKMHLRSKYGIDWDRNRAAAPPRAHLNETPSPQTPAQGARVLRRPSTGPKLVLASSRAAQQQLVETCAWTADVTIETRDLGGYGVLLARSRSYAAWTTDTYTNPFFVARWAFAFNDRQAQAPTSLGTNWYLAANESTEASNYNGDGLSAHAEQSSTYYNVDFPLISGLPDLGPTYAWHGIQADAHDTVTFIHTGVKNEYGGYSALIGSRIFDNSFQGCSQ